MTNLPELPVELARRRVLSTKSAAALLDMSVHAFRSMRQRNTLPEPVKLSDRRLGWRVGDLLDFLDCRQAGKAWKDCRGAQAAAVSAQAA